MKNLKELEINSSYYSEGSDLLKDFYNPILSCAKRYLRITSFFSSNSFAVASRGIGNLIKNGGEINLITGFFTNQGDVLLAEEVMKYPERLSKELDKKIGEFENIEDAFSKESLKAFAWLLSKEKLRIKIALPRENYKSQYGAIFHQKIGIVEDLSGNSISFSGSINETASAWKQNIENFKVFRNWVKEEEKYFEEDRLEFHKLWNNVSDRVLTISLPEALRKKIIKFAPKNKEDIDFNLLEQGSQHINNELNSIKKIPPLRDYQIKAMEAWEESSNNGIIEMATGTGKTILGIKALDIFLEKKGISIILTPTIEICKQWIEDIKKFLKFDDLILVTSKNISWKKNLTNSLHHFKNNRNEKILIISTYDSLDNLLKIILKNSNERFFILGDEVHSFGSEKRSKFLEGDLLKLKIDFKLGLSATPKRLFDSEGSKKIEDFFGDIIFRYTIGDAIKDKHLSEYEYYVFPLSLTKEEYNQYLSLTKKIGKSYHLSKDDEKSNFFELFINKRAKIIKSAENKLSKFDSIIRDLKITNDGIYTLIFCIDSLQLKNVSSNLERHNIVHSKITGEESPLDRDRILESFAKGDIPVLLSMKVLDEGINIPKIKNAIILSSSRNPREYVQRRGRVLRKSEESKVAKIYDFLVLPPDLSHSNEDIFEIEKRIIEKEIMRVFEFAKYCNNWKDVFDNNEITKVIKKYKLSKMYDLFLNED